MKKKLVVLSAVMMMAVPVAGFAAPTGKYAKQIVVAISGGEFNSPIAAVGSITDASATNPYLVKVMPGVYNLGTSSLVMKPFVNLEGSGDSSVITSQVVNPETQNCAYGTVTMANNSTVSNILITNTGAGVDDGMDSMSASVAFQGVTSTLENAHVITGSSTFNVTNHHSTAVCALNGASATLNNVKLEAHSSGEAWSHTVVNGNDSTMVINNASILAEGTYFSRAFDCNCHGTNDICGRAKVTITNSLLEARDLTSAEGFYGGDCQNVEIVNTKIVRDGTPTERIVTIGEFTDEFRILNSQLINTGGTSSIENNNERPLKIANSLITGGLGGINYLTNARIIGSYDENFTPIPNQP
ncbi:MAG TPA: hypothetical protein VN642_06080 [Dongiaceae bacterium]|nr:hypothetical protein [Dongiaceae bacterium]